MLVNRKSYMPGSLGFSVLTMMVWMILWTGKSYARLSNTPKYAFKLDILAYFKGCNLQPQQLVTIDDENYRQRFMCVFESVNHALLPRLFNPGACVSMFSFFFEVHLLVVISLWKKLQWWCLCLLCRQIEFDNLESFRQARRTIVRGVA
jgi:hypothetical protein